MSEISGRAFMGVILGILLTPVFPISWMWTVLRPTEFWQYFVMVIASIGFYLLILLFEIMLLGLSIQIREKYEH